MKKLLIIGASILQLPAIKRAKELGFYVAVADYNPSAVGISYADEYFNVSTIDIEGVTEVARAFRPDGIMTLATDMPMRSIAAACSALGLHGISMDTAIKSTDKGEMIKAFAEGGVEHPWFFIAKDRAEFDTVKQSVSFPAVMKPTDNSGSRGVALVNNLDELEDAYSYSEDASRSGAVIIEEYMRGDEVSVEIMVNGGTPYVLAVTDKLTTGAPHFVEMGHSQPSRLAPEAVEKIKDLACRAVLSVGITSGPAHVEIMNTASGPKMVELGARMGGDCITTHLVPLSTGVDMIEATIRTSCGQAPDITPKFQRGSAIRYFEVPAGKIVGISGVDEARMLNGVREVSLVKGIGDTVGSIGSSTDRVGFVIADGDSADAAVKACEAALGLVKFEIEKTDI
ncbi:MAG: ATP-grasp domain-containing protein [Clostridia bacterium]|nr:ATP-grasp domain-containing protein [Clostridia bacterium]